MRPPLPDKHHPKWHWDFKGGGKFDPWENYTPDGIKIPKGSIYGKDFNPAVIPNINNLLKQLILPTLQKYYQDQHYQQQMEQNKKDMEKYRKEKEKYNEKIKEYYKNCKCYL